MSTNEPNTTHKLPNTSKNKLSKRVKLLLAGLLAGLLVCTGVAAAYYGFIVPNKPENILKASLRNTFVGETIQSGELEGSVDVSGEGIPPSLSDIAFGLARSESGDTKLSVSASINSVPMKLEFLSFSDKKNYIRLEGLKKLDQALKGFPEIPADTNQLLKSFEPLIQSLDGQWVELDDTAEQVTSGSQDILNTLNIKDEDAKRIAEIYNDHQFIRVDEVLPDETVQGAESHHYKLSIDKEKYLSFLRTVKEAQISGFSVDQETIDAAATEDFSKIKPEVWIRKDDIVLHQLKLDTDEDGIRASVRVSGKNFNQPVQIDRPESPTTFEALFNSFLGTGGGSSLAL